MTLYYQTELDLNTFEAWGGAVSRLEEIKELGIVELAQDYIEEIFSDMENVTEVDINDTLLLDMDDFIKDYKEERSQHIKEKFKKILKSIDKV